MDLYTADLLARSGIDSATVRSRDLSKVDLSQKYLVGADLRGFLITRTNFEYANITGATLTGMQFGESNCIGAAFVGADLRGANLAFGYFNNANFSGADLRGANLADALCSECIFAGADLRGAILSSSHYDSDFRGADLRGIQSIEECDFEKLNCDIQGALTTAPRKMPPVANKRRHPRVRLLAGIRVYDKATDKVFGRLIDMSREGLRISTNHANAVGDLIELKITLPEDITHRDSVECTARSVWCKTLPESETYQTGFHITEISPEDLRLVESLIRNRAGRGMEII